jgi:3-oxoacyl-[acyl-carrier-protein] synthase II
MTVHTACASGSQAIGEAFRTIQRGDADIMICGGCDALIDFVSLSGFILLGVLSKNNQQPQKASRPFDKKRDGFVLAEGAGVLILEELSHALKRNAHIHAELIGYGCSSNAYRITDIHSDCHGAVLSIESALKDANLKGEDIDYINAHGTSTIQNDKTETTAIKTVFGDYAYQLPTSSIKSMIGHAISATGSLELISTILTITEGLIPPTINYEFPDPKCDLDYVPNEFRRADIDTALSNSFAFGGQNATLIVKKYSGEDNLNTEENVEK